MTMNFNNGLFSLASSLSEWWGKKQTQTNLILIFSGQLKTRAVELHKNVQAFPADKHNTAHTRNLACPFQGSLLFWCQFQPFTVHLFRTVWRYRGTTTSAVHPDICTFERACGLTGTEKNLHNNRKSNDGKFITSLWQVPNRLNFSRVKSVCSYQTTINEQYL